MNTDPTLNHRECLLFIQMFKLYFSLIVQASIHVKHCYHINASLMSILNQYIRIHYMQIVFIFFLMSTLSLILSLLREDDENDITIYSMLLNRPR